MSAKFLFSPRFLPLFRVSSRPCFFASPPLPSEPFSAQPPLKIHTKHEFCIIDSLGRGRQLVASPPQKNHGFFGVKKKTASHHFQVRRFSPSFFLRSKIIVLCSFLRFVFFGTRSGACPCCSPSPFLLLVHSFFGSAEARSAPLHPAPAARHSARAPLAYQRIKIFFYPTY